LAARRLRRFLLGEEKLSPKSSGWGWLLKRYSHGRAAPTADGGALPPPPPPQPRSSPRPSPAQIGLAHVPSGSHRLYKRKRGDFGTNSGLFSQAI